LSHEPPAIRVDLSVGDWAAITCSLLDGNLDVAIAEISEFETDERLEIEPLLESRIIRG
jgi:hypothetical protein